MLNDKLERMWNQHADEYNQWSELGFDEKLAFAVDVEREECAKECEAEGILWIGEQDISDFRLCAARIRARSNTD